MGNEQSSRSVTVHPLSRLCKELQGKLIQSREDGDNSEHRHESLPRATKVNGRFVLTPESFPDYIDYGSLSDLYKWKTECEPHETYTDEYLSEQLPVIKPNQELLARGALSGTIQTTWLGHASVLTQWDGWNVLADPIFSERCSPVQWAGPKRLRPSPVQAIDLPPVDVCVISHNHYDHLDVNTVKEMNISHPNLIWMVPLGMKEWMADEGVHNVVELDWSEKVMISDLSGKNRPPLTIHCLPCQHWCSRTRSDKNMCLWSSWAATTSSAGFFFGGDTGYCPMFARIGQAIPNISLSALPIGAYGSPKERWFHRFNHMNPSEAVQTHIDLKSKWSLGIHWGTFALTGEPIMEPPLLLRNALQERNLNLHKFIVLKHGETKSFSLDP